MNYESSSYRDPMGRVFLVNDRVLRTITTRAENGYKNLRDSGTLNELIHKKWLIDTWEIPKTDIDTLNLPNDVTHVVEHRALPFISYPYEWTALQLKDAALFHLEFHLHLLERGWNLSDATAFNIQFDLISGKPIFIDFLSIIPYEEGSYWLGQNQFCEQFLNPLLIKYHKNINYNSWYRGSMQGISNSDTDKILGPNKYLSPTVLINTILPSKLQKNAVGIKKNSNKKAKKLTKRPFPKSALIKNLNDLKKYIQNLDITKNSESIWKNYSENTTYSPTSSTKKKKFVGKFCQQEKPKILWDLGCNSGEYSKLALDNGANSVVGFDFDLEALSQAHRNLSEKDKSFVAIFMDATNPTPDQGWELKERKSLFRRKNADAIIALAFVHHLIIGKNIPLDSCIKWILSLAPQGIIEFVEPTDETVQEMLMLREDIFDGYNYENFKLTLEKHTKIIEEIKLEDSGRVLFWYSQDNIK